MFTRVAAATAAGVLAVSGLATSTAHASTGSGWVPKAPSKILSSSAVSLVGGNTSVETSNLDVPVQAGDVVSFRYRLLGGAVCEAGAPRVFVETQGTYTNSWDQLLPAGKQCGEGGVVRFTVPNNGRIGAAGIVYDNGKPGQVIVSDLTVDGRRISFRNRGGGHGHDNGHGRPPVLVKPRPPIFDQPDCGSYRGSITIPLQRGVVYKVNGRTHRPGEHRVRPGRYLITAYALKGHRLIGVHVWKQYVKRGGACPAPTGPDVDEVTPVAPVLTQASCEDRTATLRIPRVEGVVYRNVRGVELEQGRTYSVDRGRLLVTAEAADGFEFDDDARAEWRFDVAAAPDCPVSNPAPGVVVVNDVPVPTRVDTGLGGLARR